MAQSTQEADIAPDLKPSPANTLEREQDHVRALRQRLNTAAEALVRVRNRLHARAAGKLGGNDTRTHNTDPACSDPDRGKP